MWKRIFIFRIILSLLGMILCPPVSGQSLPPAMQYQATGSTPLIYHAVFKWRQDQNEKSLGSRRLELNKKVRRQSDPDHPGFLATQIIATIQSEEAPKGVEHLTSQLKADFLQTPTGLMTDSFAVEAIPYFGIPLSLMTDPPLAGLEWKGAWKIRLEDGREQSIEGHYQIERLGLLAGHHCAFVTYQVTSLDGEIGFDSAARDRWVGQGRYAFDIEVGTLIAHQSELARSTDSLSQRRETHYEFAEILVH